MKKLLLLASVLVAPALLAAQGAVQPGQVLLPGDRGWKGETVQIGQPRPNPDVGGLNPADILKPLADEWRSYSGDLTGKRYSLLKNVNTTTVKNLSLKWINTNLTTGCGPTGTGAAGGAGAPAGGGGGGGGRGGGGGGGGGTPIIVGGLGDGSVNTCGPARFGGGVLMV